MLFITSLSHTVIYSFIHSFILLVVCNCNSKYSTVRTVVNRDTSTQPFHIYDYGATVARKKITGRLFCFVLHKQDVFWWRHVPLRPPSCLYTECQSTAIARQSVLLYNKHGVNWELFQWHPTYPSYCILYLERSREHWRNQSAERRPMVVFVCR